MTGQEKLRGTTAGRFPGWCRTSLHGWISGLQWFGLPRLQEGVGGISGGSMCGTVYVVKEGKTDCSFHRCYCDVIRVVRAENVKHLHRESWWEMKRQYLEASNDSFTKHFEFVLSKSVHEEDGRKAAGKNWLT